VDKSRLSIALDGPINYQYQRNTQHKKEKKNDIFFSSVFYFPDFPGPVVFGWVVQKMERANKSGYNLRIPFGSWYLRRLMKSVLSALVTLLPRTLFALLDSAASLLPSCDPSFGNVSTHELAGRLLVMMLTLTKSSHLEALAAARVLADV
jgi:hypothetical protein